jgi:hypothetical protein
MSLTAVTVATGRRRMRAWGRWERRDGPWRKEDAPYGRQACRNLGSR